MQINGNLNFHGVSKALGMLIGGLRTEGATLDEQLSALNEAEVVYVNDKFGIKTSTKVVWLNDIEIEPTISDLTSLLNLVSDSRTQFKTLNLSSIKSIINELNNNITGIRRIKGDWTPEYHDYNGGYTLPEFNTGTHIDNGDTYRIIGLPTKDKYPVNTLINSDGITELYCAVYDLINNRTIGIKPDNTVVIKNADGSYVPTMMTTITVPNRDNTQIAIVPVGIGFAIIKNSSEIRLYDQYYGELGSVTDSFSITPLYINNKIYVISLSGKTYELTETAITKIFDTNGIQTILTNEYSSPENNIFLPINDAEGIMFTNVINYGYQQYTGSFFHIAWTDVALGTGTVTPIDETNFGLPAPTLRSSLQPSITKLNFDVFDKNVTITFDYSDNIKIMKVDLTNGIANVTTHVNNFASSQYRIGGMVQLSTSFFMLSYSLTIPNVTEISVFDFNTQTIHQKVLVPEVGSPIIRLSHNSQTTAYTVSNGGEYDGKYNILYDIETGIVDNKNITYIQNGDYITFKGNSFVASSNYQSVKTDWNYYDVLNGDITLSDFLPGIIIEAITPLNPSNSKLATEKAIVDFVTEKLTLEIVTSLDKITIGPAPESTAWTDGFFQWVNGIFGNKALYDLNLNLKTLNKLIPAKPPVLSTKTLAFETVPYQTFKADVGTRADITFDVQPKTATITGFYDGESGVLSALIDNISVASHTLTSNNDAGNYSGLILSNDVDANTIYPTINANFYKVISAQYQTSGLTASTTTKALKLRHVFDGSTYNTNTLAFDIDDPKTNHSFAWGTTTPVYTSPSTKYISGVPSIKTGDSVNVECILNNFVGTHFAPLIGDIKSAYVTTKQITPNMVYATNQASTTRTETVVFTAGYTEAIALSGTTYNSKSVASASVNKILPCRLDTFSTETRVTSGLSQFPASGYGLVFDSTKSLNSVEYAEELQLLGGLYQRKKGNYTNNLPVSGPDYENDSNNDYAYVTFDLGTITDKTGFTLTINTPTGITGVESSGIRVYTKIEGATGWLNANKSYPGVGSPVNDNDACMVYGSSSASVKRVTLGSTPRTGKVYVRFGLPNGSTITFANITISAIS